MLDDLLERLETQISQRTSFTPGWRSRITEAEINEAETVLGLNLSIDYRQFLKHHNGQSDEFGVSILSAGGRLAPLEEVVRRHAEMVAWKDNDEYLEVLEDKERIRNVVYHPMRVEIGGSVYFDGENTVLDFIPGPAGVAGQILAGDSVVGNSFEDYLRRVVVGLERGLLTLTPVDGIFATLDVANKKKPWLRCEPVIRKIEPSL